MKFARRKHIRKILLFYQGSFKMHPPYQVVFDGNFVARSLAVKHEVPEMVAKTFGGDRITPCTTRCILAELRALGSAVSDAAFRARGFRRLACAHSGGDVKPDVCIRALAASVEPGTVMVATQDKTLRDELAVQPGVPLIYLNGPVVVLEPPSRASRQSHQAAEEAKLQPSKAERALVQRVAPSLQPVTRKRKRPAEPNPLSVKKPKRDDIADAAAPQRRDTGSDRNSGNDRQDSGKRRQDAGKDGNSSGKRKRNRQHRRRGGRGASVSGSVTHAGGAATTSAST